MTDFDREVPAWLDVSRETLELLGALEALVLKWTSAVNLVSKASTGDIWTRHILDSAQIYPLARESRGSWLDIGSGGGFPALVLAVLFKGQADAPSFTLVESDARKSAFLIQAVRLLDLQAKVVTQRIESERSFAAETLSARALAPLDALLGHAAQHLAPTGRAFFPKGATHQAEIAVARQRWNFRCTAHISRTDPQSAILEVEGIELR